MIESLLQKMLELSPQELATLLIAAGTAYGSFVAYKKSKAENDLSYSQLAQKFSNDLMEQNQRITSRMHELELKNAELSAEISVLRSAITTCASAECPLRTLGHD